MADNKATKTKVLVDARLSYAHIFHPESINDSDVKKYSVSLIISKKDKKSLAAIENAIAEAILQGVETKWGGKKPKNLKTPLRDGDEERDDEAYADSYFINASSNQRPGIVNRKLEPIIDEEEVYSGCYAKVSVNFYPFDANGNRGVACGLNNIMKLRDGEPLGGRVSAEVDFADVDTSEWDDDDEDF